MFLELAPAGRLASTTHPPPTVASEATTANVIAMPSGMAARFA
jgi:hypothetical protein